MRPRSGAERHQNSVFLHQGRLTIGFLKGRNPIMIIGVTILDIIKFLLIGHDLVLINTFIEIILLKFL